MVASATPRVPSCNAAYRRRYAALQEPQVHALQEAPTGAGTPVRRYRGLLAYRRRYTALQEPQVQGSGGRRVAAVAQHLVPSVWVSSPCSFFFNPVEPSDLPYLLWWELYPYLFSFFFLALPVAQPPLVPRKSAAGVPLNVAGFLSSLGLAKYQATFQAEEVRAVRAAGTPQERH